MDIDPSLHKSQDPLLRAIFLLFALMAGFCSPAWGSDPHASSGHDAPSGHGDGEELVVEDGNESPVPEASAAMPMLLVPASVNGRKTHYIFISYRVVVSSQLQVDRVNQKVAWLHDAVMREVFAHGDSLLKADNPNRVNREELIKRFKSIAKGVIGEDIVTDLYFNSEISERDPRPAPTSAPPMPTAAKSSSSHGGGH